MKKFITIILIMLVLAAALLLRHQLRGSDEMLLLKGEEALPSTYAAGELINLYQEKERHFQLASADIEIDKKVYLAMEEMFSAAARAGVTGYIITSGYRSYEQQAELYAQGGDETVAPPGSSEHQTGLAFDVTAYGKENFEQTPQFQWLLENCGDYGFILRYPQGKEEITGYPYEPWHYRYVGLPQAQEIMDEGITLEEYLER